MTDRLLPPAARSSFVGREHELAGAEQGLTTTRLLTLKDADSAGKTGLGAAEVVASGVSVEKAGSRFAFSAT